MLDSSLSGVRTSQLHNTHPQPHTHTHTHRHTHARTHTHAPTHSRQEPPFLEIWMHAAKRLQNAKNSHALNSAHSHGPFWLQTHYYDSVIVRPPFVPGPHYAMWLAVLLPFSAPQRAAMGHPVHYAPGFLGTGLGGGLLDIFTQYNG